MPECADSAPPPSRPGPTAGERYRQWRSKGTAVGGGALTVARLRRLERGAPISLLWALLFYAVAQVPLFLFMDRWHPERVNAWRDKKEQLAYLVGRDPDRPLLLMLGSSRTDDAFQAGRLNGLPTPEGRPLLAYNFGAPAAGPMHELLYLRELLDAGIRPRLLLVEFLPVLLNDPHNGRISEECWTASRWLSLAQYRRLRPYLARTHGLDHEWLESRLAPWYSYRPYIRIWGQQQVNPEGPRLRERPRDAWGYHLPEPITPAQCRPWWKTARKIHRWSLRHFQLGEGPSRAMRDLLALCRQEQIPVALVLMPESAIFRSWYNPEGLAEVLHLLDELRTTYGVEVIDASRWAPDGEFIDGHHLLACGADRFSARMCEEVQRLLVRTAARPGSGNR